MGRYLKQYDKDYMKLAILEQEETFRQQVHELHRLYRIQKLLMNDMKAELKRQRKTSNRMTIQAALDLELPADDNARKDEEESDLELTLATGSSRSRSRRAKKESSFTSDSGVSLSSSSMDSGGGEKANNGNEWGLFQVSVDEGMREERMKQSPWLFQCLSLKMT